MAKQTTHNLPPLTMRAAFAPSTLDADKRTVQLTWTTGARVLRGFWERYYEELSLDPKHVRMDRLRNGAPLLDTHRASGIGDVIGVVESAQLERGRGTATVRFDRGDAGEDAFRKVADGIVRNVSVGYRVHKLEKIEDGVDKTPVYRATDWEPFELTLAPIGADAGATVRSSDTTTNPCSFHHEVRTMSDSANDNTNDITAERTRAAAITKVASLAKLGDAWATSMIEAGTSVDEARARAWEALVRRDEEHPIDGTLRIESGSARRDTRTIGLMAEALASRFGGPAPSEPARQYVRLSAVDFARHLLEVNGVSTRLMGKSQIVERALALRSNYHTTGDFAALLTETGNRMLRTAFDAYQGGLQRACKQSSAPDFRPVSKLQLGEAPTLKKVNEHAEFTRGTMASSKESYSVATYGRVFGLSRQAIVNDDLGAFADMSLRLGRAAAEFVATELVALLTSNPTMSDSVALFNAAHGNLATGPGTAISVTSLGVAMKSMRLQKGLDGKTPIDVTPKFLIVPAALETVAMQVITQITPAQTSNVNPFAGKLEPIVEPRLDADSATKWYLAADPQAIDTIEFSYLDGANGPEVILREGFDIDGVEWKVRLDFGAGVIDFRGLYRNDGA